jgi:Ni/Co efflux regulator RcnB
MKRLVAVLVAVGTLAAPAALAQGKMDCGKAYRDIWERLDRERFAKIAPEQLAGVNRMALRAYDACQAGDEQDARALFSKLESMKF